MDVISQYVRLSKKGSTYFGLCPFHNEKTGSFSGVAEQADVLLLRMPAREEMYLRFLMEYENFTFGGGDGSAS